MYDVTGKAVETLVNENLNAGKYEATFNGSNYARGVYFAKIEAGSYNHIVKMLMIKWQKRVTQAYSLMALNFKIK